MEQQTGNLLNFILLTIFIFGVSTMRTLANDEFSLLSAAPFAGQDRLATVPMRMCDSKSQQRYAEFSGAYLDPPCEKAQGYCGIRKDQKYALSAKFLPKVQTKELFVRVTSIDPNFGWETLVWPEFSVCSQQFNITCPQSPNNLVEAFYNDSLPEGFPTLRTLVRVRLLGTNELDIKRVYICRELNLQVS